MTKKLTTFGFKPGDVLLKKYRVLQKIGKGWEGEVYLLKEIGTGIERAGKFFFPHRNKRNKNMTFYARKLHKLRRCSILIQYHTQEHLIYNNQKITFLVSEFVDGEMLEDFVRRQPGKRLRPFEALHLLYTLVKGVEEIHRVGEYHGDLHAGNIIILRHGLEFELKLVDFFQWHTPKVDNRQDDICQMIDIFYDVLGGKQWYARQPQIVKSICMGRKKNLIVKKFKTIPKLKSFIEGVVWD